MKHDLLLIKQITEIILSRIQSGFIPDKETLHFLKTSYGVEYEKDLHNFLNDESLNDGTVYELTVYPDDELRTDIEKLIPTEGLTPAEIDFIHNTLRERSPSISIITKPAVHYIDSENSLHCIENFIRKLNLDIDLQYLATEEMSSSSELYFRSRALLRKKKFSPSGDRGDFMKRLIQHRGVISPGVEETLTLIDKGVSLLAGNRDKAIDELAAKKYYFESVLSQAEEYSDLLKTWGMELLLMRKVQPSPVSADEAIESIRTIDRLTSLVYGFVIPPSDIAVQISVDSLNPSSDLFN